MIKYLVFLSVIFSAVSCDSPDTVPTFAPDLGDPSKGVWKHIPSMLQTRQEVQPVLLDGKMYVIGGYTQGLNISRNVEAYDPVTQTWENRAIFPTPRNHLATAAANGKIYTFGGFNDFNTTVQNTTHEYDPLTDSWTEKTVMPTARGEHMAVTVNNKIYVIGGSTSNNDDLGTIEVYDPSTDSWEQLSPMPTPRNSFGLAAIGEKIYVIAGRQFVTVNNSVTQVAISTFEAYSTTTDSWETLPDLPVVSGGIAAASLNNNFYAFGGELLDRDVALDICYRFNFQTNEWEELNKMVRSRHGTNGIEFDNKIYILGGGENASFGIVGNQSNLVFEIE